MAYSSRPRSQTTPQLHATTQDAVSDLQGVVAVRFWLHLLQLGWKCQARCCRWCHDVQVRSLPGRVPGPAKSTGAGNPRAPGKGRGGGRSLATSGPPIGCSAGAGPARDAAELGGRGRRGRAVRRFIFLCRPAGDVAGAGRQESFPEPTFRLAAL